MPLATMIFAIWYRYHVKVHGVWAGCTENRLDAILGRANADNLST